MVKIAALLFVLIFLSAACLIEARPVSSADVAENSWVSEAPMSEARGYLGVAAVNGKIYAIGGDQGHLMGNNYVWGVMTRDVINATEEYDTNSDTWAYMSPMPTARARFGTAVYQNKIYCIGGYNAEYADLATNEVYDPVTDAWEVKTPLPKPIVAPATSVVDGKIYVIGGGDVVEVYDPAADAWAAKTSPPLEVRSSASAVVDNKIYVLGEQLVQIYDPANDSWIIRSTVKVYNSTADSWSIWPSVPVSTSPSVAATTGLNALKRIYFFDENWTAVYDPSSDSWSVGAPSLTPRCVAGAAVMDELIYVIGGREGQWGYMTDMWPSAVNEKYTPFGYGSPDPSIDITEPFPATMVIAPIATAAIIIGFLVYSKKRKQ